MAKPTMYVEIESGYPENPIAKALRVVAFGAEQVDQLVQGEAEADIAVTNTIENALRMAKETERTSIVLVYFGKQQQEEAVAFAGRYPGRVTAMPYVSPAEGQMEIVPFLLQLIAEKSKEV